MNNHMLSLWNDGPAKRQIVKFVESVTTERSGSFVPPKDRIATFDNDGTLWSEKPTYFQLIFALDQLKQMLPSHPEWQDDPLMAAALAGDTETLIANKETAAAKILAVTHAGMTTDEFNASVAAWLLTATHPTTGRKYSEMVFAPMLQLLDYLRAHDFQTHIVSGGGVEFIRVFAEDTYGIPPQQVTGSSIVTTYEVRDGVPVLVRKPELDFYNDGPGKPVGINHFIGKRPILAFGNSDGDLEMIEYTLAGDGMRAGFILHHDDAEREFAYDRESAEGNLTVGLDEADARGLTIVSMKETFEQIYP